MNVNRMGDIRQTPCDGSLVELIPWCPLALLALLHCQSDSFRLSPSLLNYHGCFGWCTCGPSLKVFPSGSTTVKLNGPSYFSKIACDFSGLGLVNLLLRSEFPSRTKLRHNFADSVVFGVVERPVLSDFADFVFFNNGRSRTSPGRKHR